ncbi:MAG: MBL fold metallo-hydrolase RNA specificity domain-containing protein [Candidatus Anstonellales archaeon]
MRATFYGGAGEIGRSCIQAGDMLLDAGIKLGKANEFPAIGTLDGISKIIVTHAHLDHCGYLAHLSNEIAEKDIITTPPTKDLMGLLLSDYASLAEDIGPGAVEAVMRATKTINFHKIIRNDGRIRLHRAGHILGAAMVEINNGGKTIIYTGDMNNRGGKTIAGCERIRKADTLIIEGTYCLEDRKPIKAVSGEFERKIREVIGRGGTILIPVFAVGRGEEILLTLHDMAKRGTLKAKIYVDGMVKKAYNVYRQNILYARKSLISRILLSDDDPFKSPYFIIPKTMDKSDVEGGVIVTTSGMLTGGPIVQYLKRFGGDENNAVVLTGYQAEGTPGRQLLDGMKKVEIGGENIEVRAQVWQADFSGHADRNGLISFVKGIKGLKKIVLVHGERGKMEKFAEELKEYEVEIPQQFDEVDL